jgi:hypothetical protein
MSNGSFTYDLTLPNTQGNDVEVKYSEDGSTYESIDIDEVEVNENVIHIYGLDHFTIFVVSDVDNTGKCDGASITKPSGTTACYTTIQKAIDNASGGDTINVSPGTYNENLVIQNKSLTLRGPHAGVVAYDSSRGIDEAIIKAGGAALAVEISGTTIATVTIDGFTIADGNNWTVAGIAQKSASPQVTSNILNNIVEAPTSVTAHGNSIQVSGDNSTVTGNQVQVTTLPDPNWSATGILSVNSSNTTIRDNVILGNGSTQSDNGIVVMNNGSPTITGNTVESNQIQDCDSPISIQAYKGDVLDMNIQNNMVQNGSTGLTFTDFNEGHIATYTEVKSNTFSNNDIQVDVNNISNIDLDYIFGNNTFDKATIRRNNTPLTYTGNKIYSFIQGSIDDAEDGDTIQVLSGTYNENLTIDKALSLVGEDKDSTIISPASGKVININAHTNTIDGLTIQGFTLRPQDASIALQSNSGVNNGFDGANYLYKDLIIDENGFAQSAIGLFDVDTVTLDNVIVKNSTRTTGGAIEMIGVKDFNMINSHIYSNEIGIKLFSHPGYEENSNIIISNTKFTNNAYGIINEDEGLTIEAINNWWGDSTGPYHPTNLFGLGDTLVGKISFCPWFYTEDTTESGELFGPCLDEERPVMGSIEYFRDNLPITQSGTGSDPVYVQSVTELSYNASFSDDLKLDRHVFVIYDENPNNPGTPHWVGNGGTAYCSFGGTDNTFDLEGTNNSITDISFENCVNNLPEGRYVVVNRVYDVVGEWRESYDLTFVVDTTRPIAPTGITIFDHEGNELGCNGYTNNRRITVNWNDNEEDDFSHYIYGIKDNEYFTTLDESQNTGNIRNIDGEYRYIVRAVDFAGNISEPSEWCHVTLDRVDLEILSIEFDRDIYKAGDRMELTLNVKNNGTISTDQSMNTLYAAIGLDRYTWREHMYRAEMDIPTIASGEEGSVLFYIDIPEPGSDTSNSEYWTDDDAYTVSSVLRMSNGYKDYSTNNGNYTFAIDNTAPLGTIDYLFYSTDKEDYKVEYFITNDNTPVLGGTCSDNMGLDSVLLEIEGQVQTITCENEMWKSNAFNELDDGTYLATLTLTDLAGNETVVTETITIDIVTPTAEHTYYRNGTEITDPIAYVQGVDELTFTAEYWDDDPSSGLSKDVFVIFRDSDLKAYCSWRQFLTGGVLLNGSNYQNLETPQSLSDCVASLDDGAYHIRHRIYDNATRSTAPTFYQHRQYVTLSFVVDTTKPQTILDDISDTYHNTRPFDISGTSTDDNGVAEVRIYGSNTGEDSWTYLDTVTPDITGNWTYPATPPDEGSYDVKIEVVDLAGNIEELFMTNITVDETDPASTITSPSDGHITNETPVIEGETTDNFSVDYVVLSYATYNPDTDLCGDTWTQLATLDNPGNSSPFNWVYDEEDWGLEDGIYCIKAQGTDLAGNTEQSAILKNLVYDKTPPTIKLIDIITDLLLVDAEDNLSGTKEIQIRIGEDGKWQIYEEGMSLRDLVNNEPGTYKIYVRLIDAAGNTTTPHYTFFTIPAPTPTTAEEVLGAIIAPFTPQPTQAAGTGGYLYAQTTTEEETEEEEEADDTEVEDTEDVEDEEEKDVKGTEDENDVEEEQEGRPWWIYPLIILPLLLLFIILWKRRKEDEEPQY